MSPLIARDVWITKEGQELRISEMSSSHLLSTIHMIERRRLDNATEVYHERHVDGGLNAINYYLTWPVQYDALIAEAERRKILERAPDRTRRIENR